MGSEDTETPDYQVGEGCLVDQLVGQYLADVAAWGRWSTPPGSANIGIHPPLQFPAGHVSSRFRAAHLRSERRGRSGHLRLRQSRASADSLSYYAEAWTGHEYTAASEMIFAGLVREGVECFENVRKRFDGERRIRGMSQSADTTTLAQWRPGLACAQRPQPVPGPEQRNTCVGRARLLSALAHVVGALSAARQTRPPLRERSGVRTLAHPTDCGVPRQSASAHSQNTPRLPALGRRRSSPRRRCIHVPSHASA